MLGFSREEVRMRKTSRRFAVTAVSLLLAVAALDCARKPSSEPLQVTYYYLPG
jgi:hypothetical protein